MDVSMVALTVADWVEAMVHMLVVVSVEKWEAQKDQQLNDLVDQSTV